jgi:hypothetical protein
MISLETRRLAKWALILLCVGLVSYAAGKTVGHFIPPCDRDSECAVESAHLTFGSLALVMIAAFSAMFSLAFGFVSGVTWFDEWLKSKSR